MSVAISVTVDEADLERLYVDVTLGGLTVGDRYDVHRVKVLPAGEDPVTGDPRYALDPHDRKALWSGVAHRVGWEAPAASTRFRDYDAPVVPFRYFVVRSALVGPAEHDWRIGRYPTSRGVLSSAVVDFNGARRRAEEGLAREIRARSEGEVVIRSTRDLGAYVTAEVESLDVRYVARGTEHAVIGRQYPLHVADTREGRRGTVVLLTRTAAEYEALRDVVFPPDATLYPVILAGGSSSLLLLDAMRVVPLDVKVEHAGHSNPHYRFVSVDFVEVDPTTPLVARAGDNDDLVNAPRAAFTLSTTSPVRGQAVTLTDTSTGQYDAWTWTIERAGHGSRNDIVSPYAGPHVISWRDRGRHFVRLRVSGPAGSSSLTRYVTVR